MSEIPNTAQSDCRIRWQEMNLHFAIAAIVNWYVEQLQHAIAYRHGSSAMGHRNKAVAIYLDSANFRVLNSDAYSVEIYVFGNINGKCVVAPDIVRHLI
jgi:hypothetical protein